MKSKIPYAEAIAAAEILKGKLAPGCERTLIAGSLRRGKPEVGDIELVVMPKVEASLDLFGAAVGVHSLLDDVLAELKTEGYTKNGERYKQFIWHGYSVDLFIATLDTWGCVATIRTGSADFTHWLVSPRRQGGGCPSHLKFSEGRIVENGKRLDTPEEADVFAALNQPWVEPAERIAGRWVR